MKKIVYQFTAASLLVLAACGGGTKEDDHGTTRDTATTAAHDVKHEDVKTEESAPPDSAAMVKAWQDYATPGPMHKWMEAQEGKWDGEMISWMTDGGPPSPASKVKAEFKMILNGLYQKSEYKGEMGGMKFEGTGLTAYDNARKKFMTTWVDNMGSGMLQMEGDYDEASKSITFNGPSTDPVSGRQSNFREVMKMVDEKNIVMEMYGSHAGGKEFKMLEIRLTKK
jgi:hypothetical protein